jgi:hypothetical protein
MESFCPYVVLLMGILLLAHGIMFGIVLPARRIDTKPSAQLTVMSVCVGIALMALSRA